MSNVARNTNQTQGDDGGRRAETGAQILEALLRIERLLNDGFGAHLNSAYPYGKPTDRWRRSV